MTFTLHVPAATVPSAATSLFTVTGGPVLVHALVGVVTTSGTAPSGVNITDPGGGSVMASAPIASVAAGTTFAPKVINVGSLVGPVGSVAILPFVAMVGTFTWDGAGQTCTAAAEFYVKWEPQAPGAYIS